MLLFLLPLAGCSSQSEPAQEDAEEPAEQAEAPAAQETEQLVIKESGYTVNNGYVHYAVAIENQSTTSEPDFAHILITGTDDEGDVVFSDDWTISHLPCSTVTYWANQAGNGKVKKDTKVEFEVTADTDAWQESNLTQADTYTFSKPKFQKDNYGNGGSVTGTIELAKEPPADEYLSPMLVVVFRDAKGKILTGDETFVDHDLKMGKKTAYEVTCYHVPKYETIEVHANPW